MASKEKREAFKLGYNAAIDDIRKALKKLEVDGYLNASEVSRLLDAVRTVE